MKKLICLGLFLSYIGMMQNAEAAPCQQEKACTDEAVITIFDDSTCDTYEDKNFSCTSLCYRVCTHCKAGYDEMPQTLIPSGCSCNILNYFTCESGCSPTCNTYSAWATYSSINHSVSRSLTGSDGCGSTCSGGTQYGCAAGYSKSSGSGSSIVCTACPDDCTTAVGNTASSCAHTCASIKSNSNGTYTEFSDIDGQLHFSVTCS